MPDLSKLYKNLKKSNPDYIQESEQEFVSNWKGSEDKLYDKLSQEVEGFAEKASPRTEYEKLAKASGGKGAGFVEQQMQKAGKYTNEVAVEGLKPKKEVKTKTSEPQNPVYDIGQAVIDNPAYSERQKYASYMKKEFEKASNLPSSMTPIDFINNNPKIIAKRQQFDDPNLDELGVQRGIYETTKEGLNDYTLANKLTQDRHVRELNKRFPGAYDSFIKESTNIANAIESLGEPKTDSAKKLYNSYVKKYQDLLTKNEGLVASPEFEEIKNLNKQLSSVSAIDENLTASTPIYQEHKAKIDQIQNQVNAESGLEEVYSTPIRYAMRTADRLLMAIGEVINSDILKEKARRSTEMNPSESRSQFVSGDFTVIDGKKYMVSKDEDGVKKVTHSVDKNYKMTPLDAPFEVPKGAKVENEWSVQGLFSQLADVGADMIVSAALTGGVGAIGGSVGGFTKGLYGAKKLTDNLGNLSKTASALSNVENLTKKSRYLGSILANGTQALPEYMERARNEGLTEDEALFGKIATGLLYGIESNLNPIELKMADKFFGTLGGEVSKSAIQSLSGTLKKGYVFKKAATQVGKAVIGENVEEVLLEPLISEGVSYANSKMYGFDYKSKFPDAKETMETIAVTTLFAGLMGGFQGDFSRSKIMNKSMALLMEDPNKSLDLLDSLESTNPEQFSTNLGKLRDVLKEAKGMDIDEKSKNELASLLYERTFREQRKSEVSDNAVTSYKYQEELNKVDEKIRNLLDSAKPKETSTETAPEVTPVAKAEEKPAEKKLGSKLSKDENYTTLTVTGTEGEAVFRKKNDAKTNTWVAVTTDENGNEVESKVKQSTFKELIAPKLAEATKAYDEEVAQKETETVDNYNKGKEKVVKNIDKRLITDEDASAVVDHIGDMMDEGVTPSELRGALDEADSKKTVAAKMKVISNKLGNKIPDEVLGTIKEMLKNPTGSMDLESIIKFHEDNTEARSIVSAKTKKANEIEATKAVQLSTEVAELAKQKSKLEQERKGHLNKDTAVSKRKSVELSSKIEALADKIKEKNREIAEIKKKTNVSEKLSKTRIPEITEIDSINSDIAAVDKELSKIRSDKKSTIQESDANYEPGRATTDTDKLSAKERELLGRKSELEAKKQELMQDQEAEDAMDTDMTALPSYPAGAKPTKKSSSYSFKKGKQISTPNGMFTYLGKSVDANGKVFHTFKTNMGYTAKMYEGVHDSALKGLNDINNQNISTSAKNTLKKSAEGAAPVSAKRKFGQGLRDFFREMKLYRMADKLNKVFPGVKVSFDIKKMQDILTTTELSDVRSAIKEQEVNYNKLLQQRQDLLSKKLTKDIIDQLTLLDKKIDNTLAALKTLRENEQTIRETYSNSNFKELKTFGGVTYGFYDQETKTIYLDPNTATNKTALHEFAHVWNIYTRAMYPELYAKGLELVQGSDYHKTVLQNPAYNTLTEEEILDEALVMAIEDQAKSILDKSLKQKLTDWINNIFSIFGKDLNVPTNKSLQDMTLAEFASGVTKELLAGQTIADADIQLALEHGDKIFRPIFDSEPATSLRKQAVVNSANKLDRVYQDISSILPEDIDPNNKLKDLAVQNMSYFGDSDSTFKSQAEISETILQADLPESIKNDYYTSLNEFIKARREALKDTLETKKDPLTVEENNELKHEIRAELLTDLSVSSGRSVTKVIKDFYNWLYTGISNFTDIVKDYAKIAGISGLVFMTTPIALSEYTGPNDVSVNRSLNTITELFERESDNFEEGALDRAMSIWVKVGKPEVFIDDAFIDSERGDDYRAWAAWDIDNGRITSTLGDITNVDDFVAELAHAIQYATDPNWLAKSFYYDKPENRDIIEYERVGSLEYDAHKIIEPLLWKYIYDGISMQDQVDGLNSGNSDLEYLGVSAKHFNKVVTVNKLLEVAKENVSVNQRAPRVTSLKKSATSDSSNTSTNPADLLDEYLLDRIASGLTPEYEAFTNEPSFQKAGLNESYIRARYNNLKAKSPQQAYNDIREILDLPALKNGNVDEAISKGKQIVNRDMTAKGTPVTAESLKEKASSDSTGFYKTVANITNTLSTKGYNVVMHDSFDSYANDIDTAGFDLSHALKNNVLVIGNTVHILNKPEGTDLNKHKADVTSPIHEIAHKYEDVLTEDEVKTLEKWSGFKKGSSGFREAFAKGAEKFIYEGVTFNGKIDEIFKKFKEWFRNVIDEAINYFGDINELNEEVRDIYRKMLIDDYNTALPNTPKKENLKRSSQGWDSSVEATAKALEGVDKKKLTPMKMVGQLTKDLPNKGDRKRLKTPMGDVGDNYNVGNVEVTLSEDFDFGELNGEEQQADVSINFIGVTKKDSLGKGLASKELDRIIALADTRGMSLSLVVDPQGATFGVEGLDKVGLLNSKQLKEWYVRKGFLFDEDSSYGFRPAKNKKQLAEAYHKAKADGTNPELVKAVEELLGKPKETSPTPNSKGEGTEDWSKDVESTAKALESKKEEELNKILPERERLSHRIVKDEYTTTADDMTKGGNLIPNDFYQHPEYYADLSDPNYKESWDAIKKIKGNPDAEITIYRSAPNGSAIEEGDWISLSKKYAKQEGEHPTDESQDLPVISIKVKAKEIVWDGNDINEFAYYPEKSKSKADKISEAYHKAKADGSNPELVKAVEDLLGTQKENLKRQSTALEDQIEAFGVPKDDVKATSGLLTKLFEGLKKAGLTATETVGEWVGIGKGEEKPYSLKIDGKEVKVKNIAPEIVNGFYSPIEKKLLDEKATNLSATKWLERLGKGDEMTFTGLKDFLESKKPNEQVKKSELQDFMRDNRIEVVEVVKGGEISEAEIDAFLEDEVGEGYTREEAREYLSNDETNEQTKYHQYQLDGARENYKEVLVTIPSFKWAKNKSGLWAYFNNEGVQISDGMPEDTETYKELAKNTLKKSQAKPDFKSSHFDEPNILVHLRMNTRTDADGRKVLFMEEVQSDWGQTGKKDGFVEKIDKNNIQNVREDENVWVVKFDDGSFLDISKKEAKNADEAKVLALQSKKERFVSMDSKTPTAPFVTDTNAWTKLGLKVALKEAVAQGADKIAWTTGEQQNERYDLSKQVDDVWVSQKDEWWSQQDRNYIKGKDVEITLKGGGVNKFSVNENGEIVSGDFKGQELEAVIGKEMAEKILSATEETNFGEQDLRVGGSGMKGFYGSPTESKLGIVGNVAKSLFKQEPKTIKIEIAKKDEYTLGEANYVGGIGVYDGNGDMVSEFDTKAEANKYIIERSGGTQHSIDITPELKASVEGGQPLFKDAEAQYRIESGKNIIEAIKDFNGSPEAVVALTHEIIHPTVVAIFDGAKEGNPVGVKHANTIVGEYNKANPENQVTVDEMMSDNDTFKQGTTTENYRSVQEFIAESWEKYHTEGGKGFSKAFQDVLNQIKEAFKVVYKSISGIELTPELRKMFDELLGGTPASDKLTTETQVKATVLTMTDNPMLFVPLVDKTVGKQSTQDNIQDIIKSDEFIESVSDLKNASKDDKETIVSEFNKVYSNNFKEEGPFDSSNLDEIVDEVTRIAIKSKELPLPFVNDADIEEVSTGNRLRKSADGGNKKVDRASPEIDNIKQVIAKHSEIPPDVWKALLSSPDKDGNLPLTGRALNDMVTFAKNNFKANTAKKQSNATKKALKHLEHAVDVDNMLAFNSSVIASDKILTQDFLKEVADIAEEEEAPLKNNGRFAGIGNDVPKFTFEEVLGNVKKYGLFQYPQALATVDKINNSGLVTKEEIVGLGFALNSVGNTIKDIQENIDSGDYPQATVNSMLNDLNSMKITYRRMHNAFMNAGSTAGGMLSIFKRKVVSIAMEDTSFLKTTLVNHPDIKSNAKAVKEVSEAADEVATNEAVVNKLIQAGYDSVGDIVNKSSQEVFDSIKKDLQDKSKSLEVQPIDDLVAKFVALSKATISSEEAINEIKRPKFSTQRIKKSASSNNSSQANIQANKQYALLYDLGKAIMYQYPNRVLTFEDLAELIQTKLGNAGKSVTTSDIRIAFASTHSEVRQRAIDIHSKQLSDIKKQAKIIDKLRELLEGMVLDKSTVTLNIDGQDTVFYQVPLSPDSYTNKWVKSVMVNNKLTQVDASKEELDRISKDVNKIGVTINDKTHTGGVDKTFIRVSDPVNGGMIWADSVTLAPANATERKLISDKIKKDTSASRLGTPTLHKSAVILDDNGDKVFFSITEDGKWVTLVNPETGELREAEGIEVDKIALEIQKKGPYTEIQKTLIELMRHSSGMDAAMGLAEQAAFLNHIVAISNDLPNALSGLTVDNFTITKLLERVSNMKTLAALDKVENAQRDIEEKIKTLIENNDAKAVYWVLEQARKPAVPYESKELSLAKARLRESKTKLNQLVDSYTKNTSARAIRIAKLLTNTFKSTMASLDLSVMLIQNALVFGKNLMIPDVKKGFKSVMNGGPISDFISPMQRATVKGLKQALVPFTFGGLRKSSDYYEEIQNHPYYPYMVQAKLGISDPSNVSTTDEDLFREDILDVAYDRIKDKIHRNTSGRTKSILEGINKIATLKWVKQVSEASFLNFANMQRSAMFIEYIDGQKALGNEITTAELTLIARSINDLTMKSSTILGRDQGKALEVAGYALWAPKMYLAATKFVMFPIVKPVQYGMAAKQAYNKNTQLQNISKVASALSDGSTKTAEESALIDKYRKANNINPAKSDSDLLVDVNTKKEFVKREKVEADAKLRAKGYSLRQNTTSLLSIAGTMLAVKEMLKRFCDDPETAEIGINPTKPNFGKVGCGGIYRDFTGNTSGYVRAFAAFFAKTMEAWGSGRVMDGNQFYNEQSAGEVLYEFYSRKLNPSFSVVWNMLMNKDFYGDPIFEPIKDLESAGKAVQDLASYTAGGILPLFSREVMDMRAKTWLNLGETLKEKGPLGFLNPTLLDNVNTFKDEPLIRLIAFPTSMALTAMGASLKEDYSYDIKAILKNKSSKLGAAFGKEAINFEPPSAKMYEVPLRGERDEEKGALSTDKYIFNKVKTVIEDTSSDYIRKELDKYYHKGVEQDPQFVAELTQKIEDIKRATENHFKNEGYEWGYNKIWREEALKFKDQIPGLAGYDEKSIPYKRFPGEQSSWIDKLFNTNNIDKDLKDEIDRNARERMRQLGFVKYGAEKNEVTEKLKL